MNRFSRSIVRMLPIVAVVMTGLFVARPAHAMAVYSAFNNQVLIFNYGATDALGNTYTAAGALQEITTPTTALLIGNFTIAANAGNIGNVTDTLWLYSDLFQPIINVGGLLGWVGMNGTFNSAAGDLGVVQAQMNFNDTFGAGPSSFLTTVPVGNLGIGGILPFGALNFGLLPNASLNQLTGLLAFSLAPGQSVSFPFDFSDNVDLNAILPEPSTYVMMVMGFLPVGAIAVRRMRRLKVA